ncbi:MAG: NrfD/PsrC family molybdoenzyme membrane anchor subunit [Acidimicrobiales bacterium]
MSDANTDSTTGGPLVVGAPGTGLGPTEPARREDVRAAAMRPVLERPRWWWPTVGVLAAIVVLGLVAWVVQLAGGLGAAGYNNKAFWAVYEADLVAFIGVSYGGAVVSAIQRHTNAAWRAPLTRIAEATALVTLPVGMLFIIPHLGSPWSVWELVWPPYWNVSSPILWDFFAVSTYLLATAVFFYLPMIPDSAISRGLLGPEHTGLHARACRRMYKAFSGQWVGGDRQRRLLHGAMGLMAIMIIPLAVSVHSVLSFAFASSSRAGYAETIFPVYFVVAALYSGVGLVVLAAAAMRRLWHLEAFIHPRHFVRLGFLLVAFGAAYLYLTFTEYLVDGYAGTSDAAAWVRQILIGRYWIPFWIYFVAAGLVPLLIMANRRTRTTKGVVAASGFVVAAMWVKRLVIVIPPATEPLVHTPVTASSLLSGNWGTYHFTWVPISITLAATAAIPLLLLILFRFVPVLAIAEMEELAGLDEAPAPVVAPAVAGLPVAKPWLDGRPTVPLSSAFRGHVSSSHARPRRAAFGAGLLGVLIAGGIVLGVVSTARAATRAPLLHVSATQLSHGTRGVELLATLEHPAGASQPAGKTASLRGISVSFSVRLGEFAGAPPLTLGTATTNAAGRALLSYQPTWTGPQVIVATATSSAGTVIASATTRFTAITAAHPFAGAIEAVRPDGKIGQAVVAVLLVVVGLLWITLVAVVVRVRLGLAAAR